MTPEPCDTTALRPHKLEVVRDDTGDGHNAYGGHDETLAGGRGGRLP